MGEAQPDRPLHWPHRPEQANGPPDDAAPGEQRFFRGVAAVPRRSGTGDGPAVDASGDAGGDTGELPTLAAAARRYPLASVMPARQRWRALRRGGGWTMAGLWIAVICWGVWAVSQRDGDLVTAAFALGFLLGTAVLVFTVSRLLGRMVLEGMLGRRRRGAVPSHLLVFLLLVIGAGAFLQQTWWLVAAWDWVADALL